MVLASTMAGYALAPGVFAITPFLASSIGTGLAIASANTWNQIFEVDTDSKMRRTFRRYLPSGQISSAHAAGFATTCGVGGTIMLYTLVNPLAAGLAAGNIFLYSLVYTPLKRITPLNTEVGAVVGAIPPLIGWAAATGDLSLGALSVAYCLYAWQMPHFLSLSWNLRDDYARGGYKMLANVRPELVPPAALAYSLSLLPVGLFAYLSGVCTLPCVFTAGAAALPMVYYGQRFYRSHSKADARKLFRCSLFYLPIALAAMIAHRATEDEKQEVSVEPGLGEGTLLGDEVLR